MLDAHWWRVHGSSFEILPLSPFKKSTNLLLLMKTFLQIIFSQKNRMVGPEKEKEKRESGKLSRAEIFGRQRMRKVWARAGQGR